MQSTDQPDSGPRPAEKAGGLAFVGLLLIIAGAGSYMPLMDHAFLRNTGTLVWVLMALGMIASALAFARDRRWWIRAATGCNALFVGFSLVAFFVLSAVPVEATFAELETAPDFRLEDHTGQDVSLAETLADGPVLLVFYRGHW